MWVWGVGNNELLLIDCICTPAVTRGYAWRHTAGGPLSHRAAAEPLPPSLSRLCDPLNMHTNSPLVDDVVPGGMEFVLVPGPATGVGAPDGPGICGGCGTRARAACTADSRADGSEQSTRITGGDGHRPRRWRRITRSSRHRLCGYARRG